MLCFKRGLVDVCAAQRTLRLGLHPLLEAGCVEIVTLVAREWGDLIFICELHHAYNAIGLRFELGGCELPPDKRLHRSFVGRCWVVSEFTVKDTGVLL